MPWRTWAPGPMPTSWDRWSSRLAAWPLDRLPHLALIPLGKLAAIPYAAAWTADPASPVGRRYAIDDVMLSYAASARLLGEVARRPRQQLSERVVLVSDPTGQFPMTRRVARRPGQPPVSGRRGLRAQERPERAGHDRRAARRAPGTGPVRGLPAAAVHPRHDLPHGPAADQGRVARAHPDPGPGPRPARGRAGRPGHHQRLPDRQHPGGLRRVAHAGHRVPGGRRDLRHRYPLARRRRHHRRSVPAAAPPPADGLHDRGSSPACPTRPAQARAGHPAYAGPASRGPFRIPGSVTR